MSIEERFGKNVPKNVPKNVGKNVGKNKRQKQILEEIKKDNSISFQSLTKKFQVSEKTIERDIRDLRKKIYIKRVGPKKGGHWKIINN